MTKPKSVTIQDVARASGCSPATVSLVLNNSSRRISAETRERVLKTVRETRYQPSTLARGEQAKQLRTLGIISGHGGSHFLHYSYYLQILGGAMDFAQGHRLNLLMLNEQLWGGSLSDLRLEIDGRCGGVIVVATTAVNPFLPALRERGIPFVLVGNLVEDDAQVSFVDVDNRAGAREVVRYLIGQGHRRIGITHCHWLAAFDRERLEGYRDALREAGISPDPALEYDDPLDAYSETSGRRLAYRFLETPPALRPTALFCVNDQMVYGALGVFEAAGVRVPENVSIAGFDDEQRAATTNPPLTTLRQPLAEIGAWAAQHLVELIGGGPPGVHQLFPGTLIVRGSVAPPASARTGKGGV